MAPVSRPPNSRHLPGQIQLGVPDQVADGAVRRAGGPLAARAARRDRRRGRGRRLRAAWPAAVQCAGPRSTGTPSRPAAAWILLLWAPLTLLGGLLDPAQPKLRLQLTRYWFPVFPAVFLGGVAVAWLAGRAAARAIPPLRRSAGTVAVVAGVTAAVAGLSPLVIAADSRAGDIRYRVNGASQLEDLRSWLAHHPDVRVIWTDWRTAKVLPLFTTGPFGGTVWDGEIRVLRTRRPAPTPARDEYIALYNTDRGQYCGPCRVAAVELFGNPPMLPATWTRAYQTPDGVVQIYRVR